MTAKTFVAAIGICVSLALPRAAVSQTTPTGGMFNIAISVPLDLKNLNPAITDLMVLCDITQPGMVMNQGIRMTPAQNGGGPAVSMVTNGAVQKTVVAHYTASRAATFAHGEVWTYACHLQLNSTTSTGAPTSYIAGSGPGVPAVAQLASGNGTVSGTFTLP